MATVKAFWISSTSYSHVKQLGARSYPLETGGLLLGYVADNGATVVTHIIGPGPNAKHRRHRFAPDFKYQQSALEAHHFATNGRETYLGDWHTHPDGVSALSRRDKKTLRTISATPEAYAVRPLMAIASGGPDNWNVGAFRLEGWKKRLLFVSHDITVLGVRFYD